MVDPYRAARQFERMFPEVARQEHLRATDPEGYEQHMRGLARQPIDPNKGELIATIVYDMKNGKIRFIRPNELEKKADEG